MPSPLEQGMDRPRQGTVWENLKGMGVSPKQTEQGKAALPLGMKPEMEGMRSPQSQVKPLGNKEMFRQLAEMETEPK